MTINNFRPLSTIYLSLPPVANYGPLKRFVYTTCYPNLSASKSWHTFIYPSSRLLCHWTPHSSRGRSMSHTIEILARERITCACSTTIQSHQWPIPPDMNAQSVTVQLSFEFIPIQTIRDSHSCTSSSKLMTSKVYTRTALYTNVSFSTWNQKDHDRCVSSWHPFFFEIRERRFRAYSHVRGIVSPQEPAPAHVLCPNQGRMGYNIWFSTGLLRHRTGSMGYSPNESKQPWQILWISSIL
jgi:hypothetical protein